MRIHVRPTPARALICVAWCACGLPLVAIAKSAQAADVSGEQLYVKQCASCHGAKGEGVKDEYPDPLIGTRTLESLTKYIDKRMPEDNPKSCAGKDAEVVAGYIYDAFYSPAAQAKKNPLKLELTRLTATQHRQSLADLIATFTGGDADRRGAEEGLRGEYANAGRRFRDDKIMLRRTDATVDFDFGESGPDEKVSKEEYAIRWTGSIFIPRSGEYEFVVVTKNGMRLWVNDDQQPLIDAWVRSGDSFEYREPIYLLGGRSYPIRLEMFKEKKEQVAAVTLKWRPPQRADEVIPAASLSPTVFKPVFVVHTPFPPDDRSMGYERGTFISQAWDEATTDAALETATYIAAHLSDLAGVNGRDSNSRAGLIGFCTRFAERAFRRPLTDAERRFFVEQHFTDATDLELAVKKAVLLTLKSPRFLYHDLQAPAPGNGASSASARDAYTTASRIAFALWDSLPDQELLDAAKAGKLTTRDEVTAQVRRMLPDPRTKAKMLSFFHTWLQLDRMHELSKDPSAFPDFDKELVSDLRKSLDMFLDDVMWSEKSDLRELVTSDAMYLNGRLAAFYGIDLPTDPPAPPDAPEAPFQMVTVKDRSGVLTHPLLMAGFAYNAASSPIHRGVFVSRNLLGRRLRPPPVAIAPLGVDLHPDMTTRQRVVTQTNDQTCMACHRMINPLGFTFENFDAVGRFRDTEVGKPVDATGSYQTTAGDVVQFKNTRDLAAFLIGSEEAQGAFVERLFHHAIKQPMLAYGYDVPDRLRSNFVQHEYNMKELLVDIVATATMK